MTYDNYCCNTCHATTPNNIIQMTLNAEVAQGTAWAVLIACVAGKLAVVLHNSTTLILYKISS